LAVSEIFDASAHREFSSILHLETFIRLFEYKNHDDKNRLAETVGNQEKITIRRSFIKTDVTKKIGGGISAFRIYHADCDFCTATGDAADQ